MNENKKIKDFPSFSQITISNMFVQKQKRGDLKDSNWQNIQENNQTRYHKKVILDVMYVWWDQIGKWWYLLFNR